MQTQPDPLSTTFAALADPTRRAILARLTRGRPRSRSSLLRSASAFRRSRSTSRSCQRAGLIEQGRQAQWRPCRLKPERLRDVADWVGQYRRHWEESFERLDDYLRELQATEQNDDAGIG